MPTKLTRRLSLAEARARDERLAALGLTRRREQTSVITTLRKSTDDAVRPVR